MQKHIALKAEPEGAFAGASAFDRAMPGDCLASSCGTGHSPSREGGKTGKRRTGAKQKALEMLEVHQRPMEMFGASCANIQET